MGRFVTQTIATEVADAAFAFTVTQLTDLVRQTIRANGALRGVLVRGEMSNVMAHASGRVYFTLKDERSQVACVLFRGDASRLRFEPEDGLEVLVAGDVDVFPARGQYELVAREVRPLGAGAWWLNFQQARMKLEAEGLTSDARKRPLPAMPRRVGLITSPDGAAYHDVLRVLADRWPATEVVVSPAPVQGDDAPAKLIVALQRLARLSVDVVVIARGGGSAEDLACFNDERLARAVARSPVPVVSAIGHETDVTLLDFVADARAATPTRAAQLVVPDRLEVGRRLSELRQDLTAATREHIDRRKARVDSAHHLISTEAVGSRIRDVAQRLDATLDGLRAVMERALTAVRTRMARADASLRALGPGPTLARGFAVVLDARGTTVSSIASVASGDPLRVIVRDGEIQARVSAVKGAGT